MESPTSSKRQTVEYKFLRQNVQHPIPRMRFSIAVYLTIFQIAFIILYGFFTTYKTDKTDPSAMKKYSVFMDVHVMVFIGFAFLMAFLKRYGYGSLAFNFLIGAYVVEWSLLVRGLFMLGVSPNFTIGIENLLVAEFCAATVLISFGAVIGKVSLSQLVVMATVEVVLQTINEYIGRYYFMTADVGHSMFVHVFGAYFGLAVTRILFNRELESTKENSHYHSDLFSMLGTLFLWVFWPSFNSAYARDETQMMSVVNTYFSMTSSCIATFIISILVSRGRINMQHVQFASLAGGIAIGSTADMSIQPFGAMIIGTVAGIVATLGYEYVHPFFKRSRVHDTCGVHNLFGLPGILSGLIGAVIAALATSDRFNGSDLYKFYPARVPAMNSTDYIAQNLTDTAYAMGGAGRSAKLQGGYQIAALLLTLAMSIVGGIITAFMMKLPIIEQIEQEEEMFDDEPHFLTPEDYSLKLTEVRVRERDEQELEEKRTST